MWVVYVPRKDDTLQKIAKRWIPVRDAKDPAKRADANASTDRRYKVIVVMYPEAIPDADTLTNLDVVYVMGGHCKSDSDYLGWPSNDANPIEYGEVANRLMSAGLQTRFAGKIKVYSCQSGLGDQSFGKRFAGSMKDKGFGCEVWAYTGNISTDYMDTNPPADPDSMKLRIKARQISPDLREKGGIHKFMQLQSKFYEARNSDSKVKVSS